MIIMSLFIQYNTYQTLHEILKRLIKVFTVRISHSAKLYLKLSLLQKLLLKHS